jgi:predicted nucleic acid-binding protein
MTSGKPRFYWDSAPLIAWIKDEKRNDPSEMAGLAEVVETARKGEAIIMTSVLWRAEILNDSLTTVQRRRLEKAFNNHYIIELNIDSRVMALAGEIRSFYRKSKKKDIIKNIRVPDAIHLSSAIHYDATEFHTFDGAKQDGQPSKLFLLNGNVAGHKLKICVPRAHQLPLDLSSSENDPSDETS